MTYAITILNHLTSVSKDYTIEANTQAAACDKAMDQALRDNKGVQPWLLKVIGIKAQEEVE